MDENVLLPRARSAASGLLEQSRHAEISSCYEKTKYCHRADVQVQPPEVTPLRIIEMLPKQSDSASHRARAAIYAQCAERAVSPEAAAALHYLEEMWLVIAEVADVNAANGSRSPLGSDPHQVSPE